MNTENLNKENFWDEMYEKYPKATKKFCDWMDKYKAKNQWGLMLGHNEVIANGIKVNGFKYHDLPLAMQVGIWIEFVCERGGCSYEVDLFDVDWREEIKGFLELRENE